MAISTRWGMDVIFDARPLVRALGLVPHDVAIEGFSFILFGRQTAIALFWETSEPQALCIKRKILRSAKWNPFFNSGQAVRGAEGKDLRNESLGFLKPSHLCGAGRKNEKRGKQVGLLSNGVSRPL